MPRLVIKTKKKRAPTGELSRFKEQLRRLTEQLTSRDRELTEAAATGTNLQSVMDAIAQNAAELCDAVDAVVWRVDGKASTSLHTLDRSDAASSRGGR
jgi:hypothetical protein